MPITTVRISEELRTELDAYRRAEGLETLSMAARRLLRPALIEWREGVEAKEVVKA